LFAEHCPLVKLIFSIQFCSCFCSKRSHDRMTTADNDAWKHASSVYEFRATDIDGNDVSLEKYKGKVLLIVNVACNCGFTAKNYAQLQELYAKYAQDGLCIAAFPCNQFGGQEPWPEAEIKKFILKRNISFDMFAKIDVNGSGAHPLYNYLKMKQGGTLFDAIKWNFTKFLVDRQGQPVQRYAPTTEPNALEVDLCKALGVAQK